MRGQVVLEFLLMVAIALIIGVVYLSVGTRMLVDTSEQQRIDALDDVGYSVQDEIILATQVADGYKRSFVIPDRADRFTYTMSNSENSLTLASGPTTLVYYLPNITGTFQKGQNVVRKNGVITVTSS
jgi:hypothetical protein